MDFFSSIKQINGYVKHLLSRKTDVFKTSILSEKCTTCESKKVQGIFRETFILLLSSSAVFRLQNCVWDFFKFALIGRWKAFIRVT